MRMLVGVAAIAWLATSARLLVVAMMSAIATVGILKTITNVDGPSDLLPFGGPYPFVSDPSLVFCARTPNEQEQTAIACEYSTYTPEVCSLDQHDLRVNRLSCRMRSRLFAWRSCNHVAVDRLRCSRGRLCESPRQ
jgi:hypothetical protein